MEAMVSEIIKKHSEQNNAKKLILDSQFTDMYNSTSAPNASSGGGANWNSWSLSNSVTGASSKFPLTNCF